MDHTTGHLRAMKEQIDGFSVQAASCSDPKDRAFVERSMLRGVHNLDLCNEHIRESLHKRVQEALGPERHLSTSLCVPVVLLNLFNEADYVAGGYYEESYMPRPYRRVVATIGLTAVVGATIPFLYRLCYCCSERRGRLTDVLLNCCLSLANGTLLAAMYWAAHNIVAENDTGDWALGISLLQLLLFVWLQRASLPRWCLARRGRASK